MIVVGKLAMFSETSLVFVLFATVCALEGFLGALVFLHVLAKIRTWNKLFATYLALVWFLARMDAFVSNQITYLREGSSTNFAQIWTTLLVNASIMFLQRWKLNERLFAHGAAVGSFACMCTLVLLQSLFARKRFVTPFRIAFKFRFLLHSFIALFRSHGLLHHRNSENIVVKQFNKLLLF